MARSARSARSSKPAGISVRAFGRLVGVSHVAVLKGIRSGRLARSVRRSSDGRVLVVDVELAKREWTSNAGRPPRPASAPPTVHARRTPPRAPAPANGEPPRQLSLAESAIKVNEERAQQLALRNRKEEGLLVDGDKVQRDEFECARVVREAVLAIPDRLASELAAERDAARVHQRLEQELRLALNNLADRFEREAEREDEEGDRDDRGGGGGELHA
jgi:hypothetical protein